MASTFIKLHFGKYECAGNSGPGPDSFLSVVTYSHHKLMKKELPVGSPSELSLLLSKTKHLMNAE